MNKSNKALGGNPLAMGIFQQTTPSETSPPENQESRFKKEESRIKNQGNSQDVDFIRDCDREKVNFRLPSELNDWLDDLIKTGKRKHGHKIPKEIWVQAALELMKGLSEEWTEVTSIEELRTKLASIVEQNNNGN